jgi:plasmid stabilization system protein ParE
MRVRSSPEAFADRERFFEYFHARSPGGARNVLASIRAAVVQLADHPYSGYLTDDPDVRVKFVIRYPYKVFYRIRKDVVEIVHIRHTSRRPWSRGR